MTATAIPFPDPSDPADGGALSLLVRNLCLRVELDAEDRAAICALPHIVRTLEAGSYTIREADPPGPCIVLLSGFAYRQKLGGDGARQIVSLHVPGDTLDLQNLFLNVADHSVQMLTRGRVAIVQRAALHALTYARPAIARAVMVRLLVDASMYREWILNIGRRDARARVAHLLCELAVRLDREGLSLQYGYELPMTQEQLGDAIGLTAVHVNRTLKSLEAEGLIARTKRSISIPDRDRLRHVGDFNERYLHLDDGPIALPE